MYITNMWFYKYIKKKMIANYLPTCFQLVINIKLSTLYILMPRINNIISNFVMSNIFFKLFFIILEFLWISGEKIDLRQSACLEAFKSSLFYLKKLDGSLKKQYTVVLQTQITNPRW